MQRGLYFEVKLKENNPLYFEVKLKENNKCKTKVEAAIVLTGNYT